MKLDWALLANSAEVPPSGLVYILGAGFDTLIRDDYPTPFAGSVVLRLLSTRLETERPHKVEVHITDEDGRPVLPAPVVLNLPVRSVPADYPHGWEVATSIVVNLATVPIEAPGHFEVQVFIDDHQVRALPFRAVKQASVQTV